VRGLKPNSGIVAAYLMKGAVVARKRRERKADAPKKSPRPKVLSMDELYRLINRVQINKKEVTVAMSHEDAVIASNVLRDAELKYDRKDLKSRVSFTIHPPEGDAIDEDAIDVDFDIDFFEDEIPEDGQVF
jgi:hypothetical protein